jgi:hemolysin activation/secretion protein
MNNKYPKKLKFTWLPLSIFVLINSTTSEPLKAQTRESEQVFSGNFHVSQQLPPVQDVQPSLPPPLPPPQPIQPLPPPAELLPLPNPNIAPEEELPTGIPATIVVKRFEVVGSTVFSPEELAKATEELTNRPISLVEVFQARAKITDLYVKQGYITSGAYIPPQTIKSGVVKIQVIEGKLEEIQVKGNQRLNSDYVRSRIALATSAPLNRDRLLEALQLLQLNPLIQNLSAELSTGARPGSSVLEVKIREAKTFNTQVSLDNGRSPSIGSFRRQINLSEANLLGLGDSLSVGYTNTDGSNGVDATYTLPVNPRNGTLSFSFSDTSSNVIERPFNLLDIQSGSRYYELTYRQPIFQSPRKEFVLGLTASRRESEASYISGARLPFPSVGADEQGRTRVSALRFFQEWTARNSREVVALRSQFNFGIDLFNATINENPPDSRFFAWQGQAQWVRLLAPDTLLLLRGNMQLSSRYLLPLEQFGLGGLDSVRGYRQYYLLTDNGTFATAEIQIPVVRVPEAKGILHVIPFVDFGLGWNSSGRGDPSPNTLAGVGLGLRWTQKDRLTARLDWGIPLVSVDSPANTWQENGLYFSLQYNPF